MWETQYLHVLDSRLAIIEWTRATGMKPYLDSLSKESEQAEFEREVCARLEKTIPFGRMGRSFSLLKGYS